MIESQAVNFTYYHRGKQIGVSTDGYEVSLTLNAMMVLSLKSFTLVELAVGSGSLDSGQVRLSKHLFSVFPPLFLAHSTCKRSQ
jgi:hypothetical protein